MQILWNLSVGQNVGLWCAPGTSFTPPLVLLYDSELGKAKFEERYGNLEKPNNFRFKFSECFADASDCCELLEKDIREQLSILPNTHVVVAFDVLASSFVKPLHYTQMHTLVIGFRNIIKAFDAEGITVTILCLGHTKDDGSEDMRGPREASDFGDMVVGFFPDEKNLNDRLLKITKCNGSNLKGYTIAIERVRDVKGKSFLFNVDRTSELNSDDDGEVDTNDSATPANPFKAGSKLANVPKSVAFVMADWFQKGVDGHGEKPH